MTSENWLYQARQRLAAFVTTIEDWAPSTFYGAIAGAAILPLLTTTGDPKEALAGIVGGLGANLIANQLEAWKERSNGDEATQASTLARQLSDAAKTDEALRHSLDELLRKTGALEFVIKNAADDERESLVAQLDRQFTRLHSTLDVNKIYVGGDWITVGDITNSSFVIIGSNNTLAGPGAHIGDIHHHYDAGGDIEPIGLPTSQQAASLALENLPAASLPPPGKTQSSGEKGVSLGGDLQESAVVTGDHNRLDQSSRVFDQRGSSVAGDQNNVAGNLHIERQNITYIVQGGEGWGVPSAQPRAIEKPTPELISESIRLDVATPQRVFVDELFDIAIAIRQPDAPLLEINDLESVISGEGDVYRREENEIVRYRVEVSAAGCEVQPNKFTFYLKAGENSRPHFVQVTPRRAGRISILVNAYQEADNALAAQTRIKLEALIHATG